MKFMNLAKKYSGKDSLFQILPISYEKNVTNGKGAKKGAMEIIKASKHLEYYDEQYDIEPFTKGIHVLPKLSLDKLDTKEAMSKISNVIGEIKDKFVLTLGGDHAVTIGAVEGIRKKDFSVIILDAHSDFRYSWNDSMYNHACVTKRLVDKHKIGVIGVRSQDIDEVKEIKENKNIDVLKAYEYEIDKVKHILTKLQKKVYLSIDVDVFDPSFIRNTGTPEPGGLSWDQVIDILELIFNEKEVIAADIVEFAPKNNFSAEAYSLAKLCYKIFSLKLKF